MSDYPMRLADDDKRFNWLLLADVAAVFERHGFPPVTNTDAMRLQSKIYDFLYGDAS